MSENVELTGNILVGYCDGCSKINKENNCTVYVDPKKKCRLGCAFSPKAQAKINEQSSKKRIGQQKQKKTGKKK